MSQTPSPKLIPLDRIENERVGGKAAQLARLLRLGLRVPDGFVIVGAAPGRLPPELDEYSARLGGTVAVRSSALAEDSAEASFAGQFETILEIGGAAAIRRAVDRCLASAGAARVQSYQVEMNVEAVPEMAVLVQRMVDASAAGVVFTADPVTGRRDRIVIDAVPGRGEALVGGYRTPDHFVLSREGAVVDRVVQNERAALDEAKLGELLGDALKAETGLGYPLDLEWAIDPHNQLYWLQARPITTLELPGPDELDDAIDPDWQLTTHNVAEVMPGAMPPLSWSVVGASYVHGMNDLCIRAGVKRELVERVPCMVNVQGHVFLNMTTSYLLGTQMFGMSKESYDLTVTGRVQPEVKLPPKAPFLQRLVQTVRYLRLIPAGRKRLDAFVADYSSFSVERTEDLVEHYRRLEHAVGIFIEAGAVHVHTSMMAIAFLNLVQGLLAQGGAPSAKSHAAVAALLAGAKLRSSDAAKSSIGVADALDGLGAVISAKPADAEQFARMSADEALQWLRSPASASAGKAFDSFLAAHGHRCVRELDLRERDWREDPVPLVHSLQLIVSAPRKTQTDWRREADQALGGLSRSARGLIRWLLPKTQEAVLERERSKSFQVWIERQLKRGYVDYAQRLVAARRLPDVDLVFFFTHKELGRLALGPDRALVRRAEHRRRLHPRNTALEFPRVCRGKPAPLLVAQGSVADGDVMQGMPLSRGVAIGRARVARNLSEAEAIQPGEILVTQFTDVGWTPYFGRAGGLATEFGSVLSHGAVVAREYGLPAISGLPGVTRRFKTGELLRLDGNTGELRRVQ